MSSSFSSILSIGVFFLILSGCMPANESQPALLDGKLVDLTYEFSSETIYWPTSSLFQMDTVAVGHMDGGYYYESYEIATAEHGGTHLDAPVHFSEGKHSTEEIPLERLVGPASVIDVSEKALSNPDYLVSIQDITNWEETHGVLEDNIILLIKTGYGKHWPDAAKYLGTALRGAEGVANLHFPGLDPEAAQWLVDNRNIDAFGIDTASIDYGQSATYETHQNLFAANIPAFENVANMDQLPAKGAYVIALPMKIKNGSGGPLRIIATLPE